jgi:hypothetical protein
MGKVIVSIVLALTTILSIFGFSPLLKSGTKYYQEVYPTSKMVTGTFGFDSGVGTDIQRENAIQAMRFQNTAGTGIITKLEVLFSTSNPAGKVRMGVYADNNGVPGVLLIDAGEANVADGWVSISDLNFPVTQSSFYWLSYNLQYANFVNYRDNQPPGSHFRVNDYIFGVLPSVFPDTALVNDAQWVMRATVSGVFIPTSTIHTIAPLATFIYTPTPTSSVNTNTQNDSDRLKNNSDASNFNLSACESLVKITIDHTKIDDSLENFPVMIHISSSSGTDKTDISRIFEELGNNSNKIAITTVDRKTQCYVEIEKWDEVNKQAFLWVKVPQISNTMDTVLFLYFDRNQPDNTSFVGNTGSDSAQNVWESNFVGVWHLAETGSGIANEFKDSTRKHHDGTGGGGNSFSVPTKTSSKIGDGQFFNGKNNYIEIPNDKDLSVSTTGYLTISGWISPAVLNFDTPDYIRWMGKGAPGQAEYVFIMYNQNTSTPGGNGTRSNWISFYVNSPQGGLGAGGGGSVGKKLVPGEWIYFCANTDMIKSNMSFNGNLPSNSEFWSSYGIKYGSGTDPLRIGTDYKQLNDWWNGQIDEIRISNVARSKTWDKADYYTESDNLLKFDLPKKQPNLPLVLNPIGDKSVNAGQLLTFNISVINSDFPIFSVSNLPPGAIFDDSTGKFSWIPRLDQTGTYNRIHFEVSDGLFTDSEDISITVNPVPQTPSSSIIQIQPSSASQPVVSGETDRRGWIPIFAVIVVAVIFIVVISILIILHRRRK